MDWLGMKESRVNRGSKSIEYRGVSRDERMSSYRVNIYSIESSG